MKLFRILSVSMAAALLYSSLAPLAFAGGRDFREDYDHFHDLLHPLEHEALPKKDFARIRANAKELVKRGQAIVKVGVPPGTAENNITEFRKELKKFNAALARFSKDAKRGTNRKLEVSFSSVHDSYEMLMGMLPRKTSDE